MFCLCLSDLQSGQHLSEALAAELRRQEERAGGEAWRDPLRQRLGQDLLPQDPGTG